MKNKMRKITINDIVYLYRIQSRYYGDNRAVVTLKIYMDGCRNAPYIMSFQCFEGNYDGAVLAVGTTVFNRQTHLTEYVNLHRPYFVRLCILKALEEGWDASEKQINNDGMQFLSELNLDISKSMPKATQIE